MRTRAATPGLVLALLAFAAANTAPPPARGDVTLPAIFGSHMVLQQKQPDRVWGWAEPGEEVTVEIASEFSKDTVVQSKTAKAGADRKWSLTLDPLPAGGPYEMRVRGENTITLKDVLVGEVWVCSGQSNMQWSVAAANDPHLESLTAKYPEIRLISVPNRGAATPQDNFQGRWRACTPETVKGFSAVGYFFGRQLHQTLGVPVGLINDAWGGSAAEAWVRRDLLAKEAVGKPLLERWKKKEGEFKEASADYEKANSDWFKAAEEAKSAGKEPPKKPVPPDPNKFMLYENHKPGNIYNGVLKPTIGYGIKGAIWYQGESNAGRAYQYRDLFPLMIKSWRDEWGIGDFPFYWVQLADFMAEKPEPSPSAWAELREAQTMTMDRLPKTGEAVIIDLGEGTDIHPRNKQDVAKRLARWALAHDYGVKLAHHSPRFKSMDKSDKDGRLVLTFDHVGGGLRPFDTADPYGFAVAGSDKNFAWAKAKVVGKDKVEVWSDDVKDPVAVRYAWADNPRCNLYSRDGLPVTPFRTDDWPGVTVDEK
jgi:sialate O-acetylesterase